MQHTHTKNKYVSLRNILILILNISSVVSNRYHHVELKAGKKVEVNIQNQEK